MLTEEKRWHGWANQPATIELAEASTAWPHYALARARLRSGKLDLAAEEANRAVRIDPRGFWPNFYHGHCEFRLSRYAEAAAAFGVCIGTDPNAAGCFLNRGLAFAALGLAKPALGDYSTALRLDPRLTVATLGQAGTLGLIPFLNSDRQPSNSAAASGINPR